GSGGFAAAGAAAGDVWSTPWAARGAAVGDFDNDGDLDVVIAVVNGRPVLLENRGGNAAGHWLSVKLVGATSSRSAIGARVTIRAGGQRLIEEVRSGGSYLSQSDLRVHVGLGRQTRVEAIEVTWPGGRTERIGAVDADQFVTIREGSGITSRLRPTR